MTRPSSTTYVRQLDAVGTADVEVVGGKAANLGELVQAGLPVPNGVVVTTVAYRALMNDPAIREAMATLETLDGDGDEDRSTVTARLRELVSDRAFDETLVDELHAALETSVADTETYSVRSSATAEDLPTASFAGQHETFLRVTPADVPARVRDCLASLFTDRAVAYRARNGIVTDDVEMAVVVQEMVDADAAGVLFTADPDSGNRTVAVVDATYGLGDSLVSGEVSGDHIRIDRTTGDIRSYEVGEKATTLRVDDDGPEVTETPTDQRPARVLSTTQLRTLIGLGDRVETLFDGPQDVEWALVDGEFVLLQSRPITSLPELPEPRPEDDRLHVYFSMGHAQAMTDPMPPLALDLWATVYGDLLNQFIGGDYEWVVRSGGRPYLDVTPFLGVGAVRDGFVQTVASVDERAAAGMEALLTERADEFETRVSLAGVGRTLRSVTTVLPGVLKLLPGVVREGLLPFVRGASGTDEYRDWFHIWGQSIESSILDASDPETLIENTFGGVAAEIVFEVTPKSLRLVVGPVAGELLERFVPGADADLVAAAARGSPDEVGTRMTLGLSDLADTARTLPAVASAIRDGQSLEELNDVEGGDRFVSAFEAYLTEFGHRTAGEFDPSRPRWRDDPAVPLGMVRTRLNETQAGIQREQLRERSRQAQRAVDELLMQAGSGVVGPVRRSLTAHLLRTYRSHIHLRDEPKHGSAHLFAAWHEALQRVGSHLVAEGALTDAADVWFLRRDELDALVADPDGPLPDVEARRRTYERNKRIDAPPLLTSEGEVPRGRGLESGPNTLVGTGISPGVVEGRARVVHELTGISLDPGDVLVCASSDPAWTPLFATAAGLVTEVGGRLTHGALVAREYGLPAVASVPAATTTIVDSQRIRVDGYSGTVELLDEADTRRTEKSETERE